LRQGVRSSPVREAGTGQEEIAQQAPDGLGTDMHRTLVWTGVGLALAGSVPLYAQPGGLTRLKAVGVSLLFVGEVILFGQAWWWGLIGLVVPGLLVEVVLAIASATTRPE
jgi:hypothetical protein